MATAFLKLQSQFEKFNDTDKYIIMNKLNHLITEDIREQRKPTALDISLHTHMNIPSTDMNMKWWRKLRELSKAPLFQRVMKYL